MERLIRLLIIINKIQASPGIKAVTGLSKEELLKLVEKE